MKKSINILTAALTSILLTSCSNMNYIGIETYNPAEVTFPKNVGTVVIVNNAVTQPNNFGVNAILANKQIDSCSVKLDSVLHYATQTLAANIQDGKYFNKVLIYKEPTRTSGQFYADVKLTPEDVELICSRTKADAVISVDRIMFNTNIFVYPFNYDYLMGDVTVKIASEIRAYLPNRPNPLATVHIHDSIHTVIESEIDRKSAVPTIKLPFTEDIANYATTQIFSETSPNFVPHWNSESRHYFKGLNSRWKEATVYAINEKWSQAAQHWLQIYTNSSATATKAKAAYNLALYYEIKGNLPQALEWATQSNALFEKKYKNDNNNKSLSKSYLEILTKRVHSDTKLNIQVGKE